TSGVQVVTEQAVYGCGMTGRRVDTGERAGMLPEQVVQTVASSRRLRQQVMIIEAREVAPGRCQPAVIQGGGGVTIDVRARVQSQPPEEPLLFLGQDLIGQGEGGGDREV